MHPVQTGVDTGTDATRIQRQALAAFLRSRREATDPVSVGVQPGPRRRTPGLRREELAQLAGISVTWYTWLEQARDIGVSRQVLESLARVLALGEPERAHLLTLAGLAPPPSGARTRVDPTLERLVHTLDPHPAYVINPWWDLLVHNAAYAALLGGLDERPAAERNSLWLTFHDPGVRRLLVDWTDEVRQLLGQLRAHLARYPDDPRGPEVLASLRGAPRFDELWAEHAVRRFAPARKRFEHPERGRLELDYVKLAAVDDERQQLVVFLG